METKLVLPIADIVVTVCSSAAGEIRPVYLGQVVRSHWAVEDPARASGSEEDVEAAFMATYRILRLRIEAFLALPLVASAGGRAQLQRELDRTGKLVPRPAGVRRLLELAGEAHLKTITGV